MSDKESSPRVPIGFAKRISNLVKSDLYSNVVPLAALIVLGAVMTIGESRFFSFENLVNILTQGAVLLILGVGATFVILMGSIDLSMASMMAFVGILAARLVPVTGYWAVPLSILGGSLLGLINGLIVTMVRVPSFISTLGMSGAITGMSYWFCNNLPVYILKRDFVYTQWVTYEVLGIPLMVFVSFVALLLAWGIEKKTRLGHYVLAIGAGEDQARLSGIPVRRYKALAFTIAGTCAGAAGVILTFRVAVGTPRLGDQFMLLTVAVVVIGGTSLVGGQGGVMRTLVGTVLISTLINGLNLIGVDAFLQQVIVGILVVTAVTITIDRRQLSFVK